jgi:hypothetical protein
MSELAVPGNFLTVNITNCERRTCTCDHVRSMCEQILQFSCGRIVDNYNNCEVNQEIYCYEELKK